MAKKNYCRSKQCPVIKTQRPLSFISQGSPRDLENSRYQFLTLFPGVQNSNRYRSFGRPTENDSRQLLMSSTVTSSLQKKRRNCCCSRAHENVHSFCIRYNCLFRLQTANLCNARSVFCTNKQFLLSNRKSCACYRIVISLTIIT